MSKFDEILAVKWSMIEEQGPELAPAEDPMPVAGGPADATQPQPGAEPAPTGNEEPTNLSPEAEVMLVRLIKKALVLDIDPEDVDSIDELHDINPDNAKEALTILMELMKKYGTQLDGM